MEMGICARNEPSKNAGEPYRAEISENRPMFSFHVSKRSSSSQFNEAFIQAVQKGSNLGTSMQISYISNPFFVFFLAFLTAWIYIMIPNTNYWVYNMVKNQWWVGLAIGAYAEIQDLCLMDANDITYVICYILGFFLPPLIHLFAYFSTDKDSYTLNALAPTSSVLVVIVCYAIDVFISPGALEMLPQRERANTFYDTFESSNTTEEELSRQAAESSEEAPRPSSEGRKNWQRLKAVVSSDRFHSWRAMDEGSVEHCLSTAFFFLPRMIYRRRNVTPGFLLEVNRWRVYAYITAFNILFNLYYYFLVFFSEYFRNHRDVALTRSVFLFVLYVAVGSVFRLALKRCGMMLDSFKMGSGSVFFLGEVMGLLFYYTFYRVLFESVTSWEEFSLFQIVHLLSEWLQYPIRASRSLFIRLAVLNDNYPVLRGVLLPHGVDHSDWLSFIALDFGIRCSVMISTGVFFLLLFITIDYVPWVTSALQQSRPAMAHSSTLIAIAVLLEIVNAVIMNWSFFVPSNVAIQSKVYHCFSDLRFCVVAFFVAACLFINPMFAFTTGNKF